jgi:hypothetical protein
MNQELLNNNFLIIKDFISKDKATELYKEFKNLYEEHSDEFRDTPVAKDSVGITQTCLFTELLIEKCGLIADVVQEPIFPTYAFGRFYKYGNELKAHKDQKACEISATVHLNGDKKWAIGIKKPNNDAVLVTLEPGEAVIYLGCEAEHWRNKYEGEEYTQVFLHYVRARGENRLQFFRKNM